MRGRKNRDEKLDEKKERKSVEKFKIDLKKKKKLFLHTFERISFILNCYI